MFTRCLWLITQLTIRRTDSEAILLLEFTKVEVLFGLPLKESRVNDLAFLHELKKWFLFLCAESAVTFIAQANTHQVLPESATIRQKTWPVSILGRIYAGLGSFRNKGSIKSLDCLNPGCFFEEFRPFSAHVGKLAFWCRKKVRDRCDLWDRCIGIYCIASLCIRASIWKPCLIFI